MDYIPPIGGAANDPYATGNEATGTEGSSVDAKAIEHPMRELVALIQGAFMMPAQNVLTQVRDAVKRLSGTQVKTITAAMSPYDLTVSDAGLVILDLTNGNVVVNLFATNVLAGVQLDFQVIKNGANTAALNAHAGNTIEGLASRIVDTRLSLKADGATEWDVVVPDAPTVASLYTATRGGVNVSGDTTVMTLNFTLNSPGDVLIDWRATFGSLSSAVCYGNARLVVDGAPRARSARIHLGINMGGFVYTTQWVGPTRITGLAAGAHSVSVIWNNESVGVAPAFNPGPADNAGWVQSDSEIIVRSL